MLTISKILVPVLSLDKSFYTGNIESHIVASCPTSKALYLPQAISFKIKSQIGQLISGLRQALGDEPRKAEVGCEQCELALLRAGHGAASLTFLQSCSCSCCRPWTPGWPAGSSSSSSPPPGRFPCFSGQCSGAFYPLLLQRQKPEAIRILPSLPGYRTGWPAPGACK